MPHFKIVSRWDSSKVLYEGEAATLKDLVNTAVANGASLVRAYLKGASLDGAYLKGASLDGAYLDGASLNGACLNYASLDGASLNGASLNYASLNGASLNGASLNGACLNYASLDGASLDGIDSFRYQHPLQILRSMPGTLRAYKVVRKDGRGPYYPNQSSVYTVGQSYEATANTDERDACGSGINVGTLDWCLRCVKDEHPGCRIVVVEFVAADIAAIPHASDGKFRLHRCKVVGEYTPEAQSKTRDAKGRFVKREAK